MATEVKLPRLAQGMETGTIVRWLKSEGDSVEKGEPLYEVDTDKATQEVEADESGVLLRIDVQEGEVGVGSTVAVIGAKGESVAAPPAEQQAEQPAEQPGAAAPDEPERGEQTVEKPAEAPAREDDRERGRAASAQPEAPEREAPASADGRIKASPLARRIARERGIELSALRGTGPEGRIVAEDVERAAAEPTLSNRLLQSPGPAGELETRPLTNVRRTIARRLTEAWAVPVFQLTVSAEMTRTQELVAKLREASPDLRVTIGDVLTKLTAAALMRHREVNARYTGEAIELLPSADIGVAVAAPAGLLVPVIPACDRRTIAEIAAARTDLVGRAREGKLKQSELEGGTFTISNLGMFGVDEFIAVLNPPQAAILAVGATSDRVVAVDGAPAVRPMVTLTLTCDHRAVDGADGAAFLRTLTASLAEPGLAL